MIIPSGVDVHDYEPTPQDIIKIDNADMFIYMGDDIEFWAKTLTDGVDDRDKIYSVSENLDLIETEEFEHKHGIEEDDEHEEHHHSEKYDTHVWLDLTKAVQITENIAYILDNYDEKNVEYYNKNKEEYVSKLLELDNEIMNTVSRSENKKIAFGGPFAYAYFIERYGLEFISAYDSCGEGGEPSVFKIKEVIEYINENKIPVIFYKEMSSGNIARTIAEETNAKVLEFNSIHTVTDKELEDGVSYIKLMRKNLDNLKESLNF